MSAAIDYHRAALERRARMGMAPKPNVVDLRHAIQVVARQVEPVKDVKSVKSKAAPKVKQKPKWPINQDPPELLAAANEPRQITLSNIMSEVVYEFEVSRVEIISPRQDWRSSYPRHAFNYLAKTLTPSSLPQIGRYIGKDHTTVISSIKRAKKLIAANVEFEGRIQRIIDRFQPDATPKPYWGC